VPGLLAAGFAEAASLPDSTKATTTKNKHVKRIERREQKI